MNVIFNKYKLINYPSGSALEFYNHTLYVVGDDVNYILCLDDNWNEISSIVLFEFDGNRIPKPEKPDLECAAIINDTLYLLGSGSLSPQREVVFIIDLLTNKIKKINTQAFFSIFKNKQLIKEINVEGFTVCKDKLLFFNRANTTQGNQLIVTDNKLLDKQLPNRFKIIPINIDNYNNIALGISGAYYLEEKDILLLTASAENTSNAYDDGEIIGSVLVVVENAYEQLNSSELTLKNLIYLEEINPVFAKQKIESVCITHKKEDSYLCTLVADNDDGNSGLFEIEITL